MRTTTIRAATAAITIAAGVMLPSFADKTLNDGLVAYLPFDDGTATNVVAGSPVMPEPSTGTAPTYVGNGMVGKCLNIPSGAYVKLTWFHRLAETCSVMSGGVNCCHKQGGLA